MEIENTLKRLQAQAGLQQQLQARSDATHHAVAQAAQHLHRGRADAASHEHAHSRFEEALLHLAKAKWHLGRFSGTALYFTDFTADPLDAAQAETSFAQCMELVAQMWAPPQAQTAAGMPPALDHQGAEILFFDGVPLVPTVCPIVLLQGSSYEMGRQYVEQVVDVYGPWVFKSVASRTFNDHEQQLIRRWHEHLERLTPDICEMVRGWVDAAKELDIALDYWNAIQLWTGHFEPIGQGIKGHGIRDLIRADPRSDDRSAAAYLGGQSLDAATASADVDLCSGCCAWGDASADRQLIAGSTTDHDCTFQATVVAYPDTGNAYIYTPFSVNGFIPQLGQYFFAGHPGMNSKGLAYVHHGGGLHGIEGSADRGYGVRRGASVFHNLRHASSIDEALAFELRCPIGDVGTILGSVGGFYADAQGAYVCEARPSSAIGTEPIVRRQSFDLQGRAYHFLYANNNAMHPRSSGAFQPPSCGYQFNPVEGWFSESPLDHLHLGAAALSPILSTRSSQGRNRYHFDSLRRHYGQIDVHAMQDILRTSAPARHRADGTPMSREDIEQAWLSGATWPSSVCHRVNAFTSIMQPDAAGNGLYMGCIGPANRRTLMHIPGHGYHHHDEVNEFWEIRLKASPEALVHDARERAQALLQDALAHWQATLSGQADLAGRRYFTAILDKARAAMSEGLEHLARLDVHAPRAGQLRTLARALRRFTTCQCRARQLTSELVHLAAPPDQAAPTTATHRQHQPMTQDA